MTDATQVSLDEVLAELDPLGAALFDAAQLRALVKKLTVRIAELEQSGDTESGAGHSP